MGNGNIKRFKGLLVSACEAKEEGNYDIFENLFELAKEELENISSEEIDASMFDVLDDESEDEANEVVVIENDEDEDEDTESNEGATLAHLLKDVGRRN